MRNALLRGKPISGVMSDLSCKAHDHGLKFWYRPVILVSISSILAVNILVILTTSTMISANIIGLISYWYLKTRYDVADIYRIDRYLKPCS